MIALSVAAVCAALAADDTAQDKAAADSRDFAAAVEPLRGDVQRILDAALADNNAYERLRVLCDRFGPRLSGSETLERAIDWAIEMLEGDGQEHVCGEPVEVPHWTRGAESLVLTAPHARRMLMLGLGGSVGTPAEGITAPVVVAPDEAGLEALGEGARGKIVLFNFPMPRDNESAGGGYGKAVRYRVNGASMAAKHGAVAALVRSVTTRSLQTPHTGGMRYDEKQPKIPTAAITVEDAEQLARYYAAGTPIEATLRMGAAWHEPAESRNVVAEIVGREKPEEVVIISGHIDAWDVGHGAHDDGGGAISAMETLGVLRRLGLRPRRTIRAVLWTNEENGLEGAKQYVAAHEAEIQNVVAALESDSGIFKLLGFAVELNDPARAARGVRQLDAILNLMKPRIDVPAYVGFSGADVGRMRTYGVPLMGQDVDMTHYFDIHHTHADTFDKIDKELLDEHVAAMAAVAYVLAEMPERFAGPTPPPPATAGEPNGE